MNARVRQLLTNGLEVEFLENFRGTIDMHHIGSDIGKAESDLGSLFKVNQKVRARVLFVDHMNRRVGLSLAPHMVGWTAPAFSIDDVRIFWCEFFVDPFYSLGDG